MPIHHILVAGGTVVGAGAYTAGGGPQVPEFQSDWGDVLGDSANALLDDGAWTAGVAYDTKSGANAEIIASTDLGFPVGMTNVIRCHQHADDRNDGWVNAFGLWAAPALNEYLYFRVYFRHESTVGWASKHAWEGRSSTYVTCNAGNGWQWHIGSGDATDINGIMLKVNNVQYCFFQPTETGEYITCAETYRLELQLQKVSGGYIPRPRLYDSSNTLLFDDMHILDGSAMLSDAGVFDISDNCVRSMQIGTNGPTESGAGYWYWGGLVVTSSDSGDDWPGEWGGWEGEDTS